jgi:hypothetical protein
MATFTIARSGKQPLTFNGTVLKRSTSLGRTKFRFHEIILYKLDDGGYVVQVQYKSQWENEQGYYFAEFCPQREDVIETLQNYNPVEHLMGYPATPSYADRQQQLIKEMTLTWENQVKDVLMLDEFIERIQQ